ncbi:MAG: hypothetical protein ACTHL8_18910, partial [Burkholderiaceae bacterium]
MSLQLPDSRGVRMSACPQERISKREFARRDGCNEKLVRRAISEGRLPRSDDGLIDAALVGTPWRKTNLIAPAARADGADTDADTQADVRTPDAVRSDASVPAPAAARQGTSRDPTYAQAMAKKEHFAAERAELEFRKRRGELVEFERVRELFFAESRRARDHWMNWPTRVAAMMAGELGVDADRLATVLVAHVLIGLADLAEPDGGGARAHEPAPGPSGEPSASMVAGPTGFKAPSRESP